MPIAKISNKMNVKERWEKEEKLKINIIKYHSNFA